MKIKVISKGETEFTADAEYQEPAIREAIEDGCNDVASVIIDYTDTERSDISHDHHATVTEDDGTVLWSGWLTGDGEDQAAPGASAIHVVSNGVHWLQCFADDPDAESGQIVCEVSPGDSWDQLAARVAAHQAEHGCAS